MMKRYTTTTEESQPDQGIGHNDGTDSALHDDASSPEANRFNLPTWLTRLMTRRTRMNQQIQLSNKSHWD